MRSVNHRAGVRFSAACLLGVLFGGPLGCGADDKFSEETSDEYTEPLTDAVIGTPSSLITVPLSGAPVEVPISGQAGASSGAGGSAGNVGSGGATSVGGSVSVGGSGPAGAGGSSGNPGTGGGFGSWHFDDCSAKSHFLADSSGLGANAQQALKASCVPGISGLGCS